MKILIPVFHFFFLSQLLAGDFFEKYEALRKAGGQAAVEAFLEESATAEAENPDYYAVAGNYWWGLAGAGAVSITAIKAGEYNLDPGDSSITDPKTGKIVGSIGKAARTEADPADQKRAIDTLTEGARKFPQRADIALGLAHVQKEMGMTEGYVAALTDLLATTKMDPSGLKWTNNAALPNPASSFIPETIQGYSAGLFNANTPATDALCDKLLAAVIDTFPDHPYAYNMKAALADANGKPDQALLLLETAQEKDPEDSLILLNLADAYAKAGRKSDAVAKYTQALKISKDPRSIGKAKAALQKLEVEAPENEQNRE